ncbi:hypothetical protein QYE76_031943 [Lolium multiflorum]|uniref:CCHC-type domain-containing protein n=1 Tax=Lolium multiflorum TaxID=4521 RepID=A0AAD8VKN5_LOLMU|nr:hypothetical protein QYE76_031943 [Lolium multiflorum]
MLVMTGHAKKLSDLGIVIPNRLGINRVLQSLPPSYKNFVMNYNMQNMNKEFPELFGMLKAAEIEIKKEHQVLMVNKTTSFKKQGKSKGKFKKGGKKAATPPMKPKNGPKPDAECYYCKEKGHWKRNCSNYLADLKSGLVKKKKEVSWASSKQCTVAKSSTESEYIAASEASSEAVWMKRFIVELGVVPSALDPLVIYCDNMGAIANAQEPRSHKRLKHIKLRYHSIREYIEDGEVVHGFNACVRCMDDTTYRQLDRDPGSSKTVFMGHRRWLRDDDPWRKRKDLFDGQDEPRRRPRTRSGEQIDELLKNWKECPPPGKKRKAPEPLLKVWKTRSVFWDLPYWKILRVPHSLDVMRITKNVCESLLGTLLNMPERTKDGPKARYDLLSIGIREELHAGRPNDDDDDDDDDDEAEDTQSRRKGKKAKKIEYYCPPRASL